MIFVYITIGIIIFLIALYFVFRWRVVIKDPTFEMPQIFYEERKEAGTDFYTIGNNWLNKNKYGLWEMYIEGEGLERGIATGKLSKELIHKQEAIFIKQLSEFVPSVSYLKFLRFIIAWFDRNIEKHIGLEYQREIFGVSLFAPDEYKFIANNYQRYLNLHAAHDIGRVLQDMHLTACTSFAAWNSKTKDSELLIGRNFDFYVGEEFAQNKMVNFYKPDTGFNFMMISWGGMVGAVSGMNEKGLTLTINGSISKQQYSAKTPTSILGREILQYASTIEEAYIIARKRDLFVSESYMISSAKEKRAVVIEKNPYKTELLETNHDFITCSNHFRTDAFKNDKQNLNNISMSDSVYRLERMDELVSGGSQMDSVAAATLLRNWYGKENKNVGMGNEKALNQFIGHHTIIFQPAELKVWVSTKNWQMGEFVCYDLNVIFNKHSGAKEKRTFYEEAHNIPQDPFVATETFRTFCRFRNNLSPMGNEFKRENKSLDKNSLKELLASNPEFYMVYLVAGDFYLNEKNYREACRYYHLALKKELPTKWVKKDLKKKIELCVRKGGSKVLDYVAASSIVLRGDIKYYRQKFTDEKCCVLIPTYNNERTVEAVIRAVQQYTDNIIVVNDGATDSTPEILAKFTDLEVVDYGPNQGKGYALRMGFKRANELGYHYAITIDSDGQHMADDLPWFLERLEHDRNAIIVGSRNMEQESVPGKSSFGNKFSNFWFRFNTGIDMPDTQSGFRLYPLKPLEKMRFFTKKYEFEIEVMVRASWRGVNIISVPIKVYYGEDRVTHFRPFKDFSRVGVLNTVLVTIALFYIKPFQFIKDFKRKSWKEVWNSFFIDSEESNVKIALTVMLGVFIGVAPIWGWQIAVAIAAAHLFRVKKALVVMASNISIPPMIPFILWGSYMIGGFLVEGNYEIMNGLDDAEFKFVFANLLRYVVGALCLGGTLAIFMGVLTYVSLVIFRKEKTVSA